MTVRMIRNLLKRTERSLDDCLKKRSGQRVRWMASLLWIGLGASGFAKQAGASVLTDANRPLEMPRLIASERDASSAEGSSGLVVESGQDLSDADIFAQAEAFAIQAASMTRAAATARQWDAIALQWTSAISLLQSISPESPSRVLAQRQLRDYLEQLQDAQRRAAQASPSLGVSSLGSDLFDAQLAGYLSYVAARGTPDVLVVGSSRALQGIDPEVLQAALAAQGYSDLNVFNFSVNGATAQVVEFVVAELLPAPLPPLIVWGDGSRAFNETRRDRTWERLQASPGYREGQAALPNSESQPARPRRVTANSPLIAIPGNLDALGFSAVSDRFDPQTYYQQVARVEGRYDGAYAGFSLNGTQTNALARLAAQLQNNNTQLVFVNLPLSGSYLDDFRLYYERQFQQFLQTRSAQDGFEVVDLLTQWENQPEFFADPSHINQDGARAIAQQLAQLPAITDVIEAARSPEPTAEPSAETPLEQPAADSILDRLRPAQRPPAQNESERRPPPPIPPPPDLD